MEYGNTIWGPFYEGDIKMVESIQRRATKMITGLHDKPYEERLKELKLPSLVYRRRRGDMIQMYKVINGLVRINVGDLFTSAKVSHTRGHPQRVYKTRAIKLQRRNSFSQRVINDWNGLPNYVVNAPSLNSFKNSGPTSNSLQRNNTIVNIESTLTGSAFFCWKYILLLLLLLLLLVPCSSRRDL